MNTLDNSCTEISEATHWGLSYLKKPRLVLMACVMLLGLAVYFAQGFSFDASSETLVVEGDADLERYNKMVDTFGGDAFLFLTFAPNTGPAISPGALETLAELVSDLERLDGVGGVFSVLDAPLLKSPPITLAEALNGLPTLDSPGTDLDLAAAELTGSPFFKELLITEDGAASALKIDIARDANLDEALAARNALKATDASSDALNEADRRVRQARVENQARQAALIAEIRAIRDQYEDRGQLHLGGVPMIAADMITYVERDLRTFGGVVLMLMIAALGLFFRKVRWVVLPILTAAMSIAFTVGFLGALNWQATVISSNFISLLGITTISLTIHLIVQYRELLLMNRNLHPMTLVHETMRHKFIPCLYTAITTIAAFGSLTVSGILPVEYFGWMMCIGIVISFLTTYTFFPAALLLMPRTEPATNLGRTNNFVRGMGEFIRWRPVLVVMIGLLVGAVAAFGISKVSLDNRFADYFDKDTEINQGMRFIDRNLGGTIPFDVLLSFAPFEAPAADEEFGDEFSDDLTADFDDEGGVDDAGDVDDFDDFDDFDSDLSSDFADDDLSATSGSADRYWYTRTKLDELEKMHRFLESKPQVGKVLSLTSLEDFALEFTEGRKLRNPEIVGILGALPDDLFGEVIHPYADPATGQMRLSGRIIESGPSFDREAFRQEILSFGASEVTFAENVQVTGMMVLFNTMLSQLLSSQVNTLAYILAIVFVMFLVLLRSLRYSLLGMIPNSLASATVIGAMGYFGIPLDMMTTTIAAVCIGIGVDDTIHYLHRFKEEYAQRGDPRVAVSFTHESIGRALFYTSLTVVIGFSVLGLSNFVPTVMFGIWTAVAMVLALIANLTLLPALLVLTHRPRDPEPVLRT